MGQHADHAGRTAVAQNVQGIMQFLQQHPPFDQMEQSHLLALVEHASLGFHAAGSVIACPADGVAKRWFLIRQGLVEGVRETRDVSPGTDGFQLGPGDGFPVAALLGERPTRTTYRAVVDTFCLQLDMEIYLRLLDMSEPFRAFAMQGASSLFGHLHQQVQMQASAHLGAQYSLDTPLSVLMAREPVACAPDTSLHEAVQLMHERQVGSIALVDASQHPVGIFTLRDLRRVVASAELPLSRPMDQFMTPDPICLPPVATAFDAALLMTRHHIAHICVAEAGRLVGVISERDLFALQRVDLVHLARAISQADSVETLVELRPQMTRLVNGMLAHGADSEQVTRVVTQLNDHTTTRVIELMLAMHGDPGIAFSWLVFGSEGRGEQTLLTDQDNGMLFEADGAAAAEAARARLLPLANAINQALDRCGLTLCKGNIMAGNPDLCLSQQEWLQRFARIIRTPEPENVLKATIFFDLKRLWGADNGFNQLVDALLNMVADSPAFQWTMAQTALRHRPPTGMMRAFLGQTLGFGETVLNLKTEGLTPFVDSARILALAQGIREASTLARLRLLAERGVIERRNAEAYVKAYSYLQLLRMRQHQQQALAGEPLDNRLDPARLDVLDRRILRESLRQARHIQALLAFRYRQ